MLYFNKIQESTTIPVCAIQGYSILIGGAFTYEVAQQIRTGT